MKETGGFEGLSGVAVHRRLALVVVVLLVAVAVAVAVDGIAHADDLPGPKTAPLKSSAAPTDAAKTELSKKDQRLHDKSAATDAGARSETEKLRWQKELRGRIGKRPAPIINIFNTWTHETIAVELNKRKFRGGVRGAKRRLAAARRAQNKEASWHLRCHFTNEPAAMDARLFAVLIEAAHEFNAPRIEIISGFRAPKYNLMLRKKGRQVARTSHHTRGEAVDFRLPGVPTSRLRKWALKLKLGGVGYYASSGFVHVDIGKPRTWRGE